MGDTTSSQLNGVVKTASLLIINLLNQALWKAKQQREAAQTFIPGYSYAVINTDPCDKMLNFHFEAVQIKFSA